MSPPGRIVIAFLSFFALGSCTLAQRFTYYAPKSGTTERSERLQSSRNPASIEGPPDIFVYASNGFAVRVSFIPNFLLLASGLDRPVFLPIVPLVVLWPWIPPNMEPNLILVLDVDTHGTSLTVNFPEITLSVAGERGELDCGQLLTWPKDKDFHVSQCEIRTISRGLRYQYTLYFDSPGSSPPKRVTVHLRRISTPEGPVQPRDIDFELASDVILK